MEKSEVLQILLTMEEKETIRREADKLGISMTAFLRLLVRQWADGINFSKKA